MKLLIHTIFPKQRFLHLFCVRVLCIACRIAFVLFSDESAVKQDESGDEGDTMEEYLAKMDKVRRESEESRKFWREELRSMNKWEKYGLG